MQAVASLDLGTGFLCGPGALARTIFPQRRQDRKERIDPVDIALSLSVKDDHARLTFLI